MDLKNWGIINDEVRMAEELKRLRIVADMAAAIVPDLDEFLNDKYADLVAKVISKDKFNDYERKNKNLYTALKFGGYIPDKNGKMVKSCK